MVYIQISILICSNLINIVYIQISILICSNLRFTIYPVKTPVEMRINVLEDESVNASLTMIKEYGGIINYITMLINLVLSSISCKYSQHNYSQILQKMKCTSNHGWI